MKKLLFTLSTLFLIISCQSEGYLTDETEDCEDCDIEITKDESRLDILNQDISLLTNTSTAQGKSAVDTIDLVLKAKLEPLYIDYKGENKLLNGNHVSITSRRLAVSYSIVGEPYGGAIDIIDIPKNGDVFLEGTLLMPDKDIDGVTLFGRTKLLFGGGLDVDVFGDASSSSFMELYKLNSKANNVKDFKLIKQSEHTSRFGNKLNSIKAVSNGNIIGSGGGNGGKIFRFNVSGKVMAIDNSAVMDGLYILDTSLQWLSASNSYLVALGYDNASKELKAFYFKVGNKSSELEYEYDVSLGNWNLNIEAKHSLIAHRKSNVLMVSLEQEGIGVFKVSKADKTAVLYQHLKSEILDANNPDEVVNSFSYSSGVLYAAAGAGGILIMPYQWKKSTLKYSYKVEVPGESVNSIIKSDSNLVVASTSGIRIYEMKKK